MIGIFDSGIGGFTVLKEIIKHYPNEHYLYYSDSINNPYGDKMTNELINITNNIVNFFINNNCKIIIIACNTTSLIVCDYLEKKYPQIKFIKTIPALNKIKDDNKVLVMATNASIKSAEFNKLLSKYKNDNTYVLPCIGLANLIEEGNQDKINNYLKDKLSEYQDKNIDSVILGCTHYPLIKDNISNILGDVVFLDNHDRIITELGKLISNKNKPNITFIDTKNRDIKNIFENIKNC